MSSIAADLSISTRWILPMTAPEALLENHTLVVRDGRILDLLPTSVAELRYAPTAKLDRSAHLLLPGLIDARADYDLNEATPAAPTQDHALAAVAAMLRAGTTCFCSTGVQPDNTARMAVEQGMRLHIGMPIAERPTVWAQDASECLTRALALRDDYLSHPTITTAFAPSGAISDATYARIATLADELDAGILLQLHASADEVADSVARYACRPIERLAALGLLTPALTAAHMVETSAADWELVERGGVALVVCPRADLRAGTTPPLAAWERTGLRRGLGSAGDDCVSADLWDEMRLLSRVTRTAERGAAPRQWQILAAATRGGAATLGIDAAVGTLEVGKWADLCCVELRNPWLWRAGGQDLVPQLIMNGGREQVSDVWVAGRQLLSEGVFTRLDWPLLGARLQNSRHDVE